MSVTLSAAQAKRTESPSLTPHKIYAKNSAKLTGLIALSAVTNPQTETPNTYQLNTKALITEPDTCLLNSLNSLIRRVSHLA